MYNHAPENYHCPFCLLIEGVKNEHFENIYDLPLRYVLDIHRVAQCLAIAMKEVYACDGVSTRQHNEPAGNQDIWHYRLHVTPRYENDNFYATQPQFMGSAERAKHAEALKNSLSSTEEKE